MHYEKWWIKHFSWYINLICTYHKWCLCNQCSPNKRECITDKNSNFPFVFVISNPITPPQRFRLFFGLFLSHSDCTQTLAGTTTADGNKKKVKSFICKFSLYEDMSSCPKDIRLLVSRGEADNLVSSLAATGRLRPLVNCLTPLQLSSHSSSLSLLPFLKSTM